MMYKTIYLTIALIFLLVVNGKANNQYVMEGKKVKLRGDSVTINYLSQGQGGITLLFLHGWCINSTYWQSQLDCFKSDYNVYAIDLPGFGKSMAQRDEWTIEEYAKDILAFISKLDLDNIVIIGHSMAGDIMLQTSLIDNSRIIGLIGVDNFKVLDVEFTPEQMEQMTSFFPLLQSDFKTNVAIYADNMLFHPETNPEIKQKVKQDLSDSNPIVGYNSFIHQMSYSQHEPQLLKNLNYKLNLINSNYFPTNTSGLKNHCLKGFNFNEIEGVGHYPMIEKPEKFNRILEKILSSEFNNQFE